ncbi:ankyrin repeat domain-containing protein 16-like [Diadema antillarum]|uniref:ankyrin repeat domain-containing protein 16-like n=1 Tax=Diadema antillarum TaxID=105358 RepID=UPI003A878434
MLPTVPDIKKGDKVRVKSDKALLKRLLPGHGGWNDDMKKELGKYAKVMKVDTDGDIIVRTKQRRWNFHPCCLEVVQKSAYTKGDSDDDDDTSTLKGLGGDTLLKLLAAAGGGESVGGSDLHKLLEKLVASDSDKGDSSDSDGELGPGVKRFHLAAAIGNVSKVTQMLSQDPHLLSSKYKNQTALFAAIGHNEPEVVKALVEAGADVTQRSGKMKGTVLHHATEGGYVDILSYLLPLCGPILNAKANEGLTPLHVATLRHQNECGQVLLLYGCSPNEKDKKGNTPLLAGMERPHDDLEFMFEATDLDVTSTNKKGFNALHQAVFHNRRKTAQLLLDRFPTLGPTLASSQSTLHIAAINNYAEMLEILLKAGSVNIDGLNGNKETPLHLAVQEGEVSVSSSCSPTEPTSTRRAGREKRRYTWQRGSATTTRRLRIPRRCPN